MYLMKVLSQLGSEPNRTTHSDLVLPAGDGSASHHAGVALPVIAHSVEIGACMSPCRVCKVDPNLATAEYQGGQL